MSKENQTIGTIAWSIAGVGVAIGGMFAYNKYKENNSINPEKDRAYDGIPKEDHEKFKRLKDKYKVGNYNKTYNGYRKATKNDLNNIVFLRNILFVHSYNNGWDLLEPITGSRLCVDEGRIFVDTSSITKYENSVNKYSAQTFQWTKPSDIVSKQIPWIVTMPTLTNEWTVEDFSNTYKTYKSSECACLFVKEDTAVSINNSTASKNNPVQTSARSEYNIIPGGKKTRRHKKSRSRKH